jgi:hypothetical protein
MPATIPIPQGVYDTESITQLWYFAQVANSEDTVLTVASGYEQYIYDMLVSYRNLTVGHRPATIHIYDTTPTEIGKYAIRCAPEFSSSFYLTFNPPIRLTAGYSITVDSNHDDNTIDLSIRTGRKAV